MPIIIEYQNMRRVLPSDMIASFKIGDFYYMFDEDAKKVAPIAGLIITERNGHPMCGTMCDHLHSFLAKMASNNISVAICEHTEKTGLYKYRVTRTIEPGTYEEEK